MRSVDFVCILELIPKLPVEKVLLDIVPDELFFLFSNNLLGPVVNFNFSLEKLRLHEKSVTVIDIQELSIEKVQNRIFG